MKSFLKQNYYTVAFFRKAAKYLTRKNAKVLMYHRFSLQKQNRYIAKEAFEKQIKYLVKNNYNIISFSEMGLAIKNNIKLASNTIVLTFDDGYSDFYTIAYPILKKYGVKATLFVTTGFIFNQFWMYQDKIKYLLEHADTYPKEILSPFGNKIKIDHKNDNIQEKLWHQLSEELLCANEEQRSKYLKELSHQLKFIIPENAPAEYAAVTELQLLDMIKHNIEIGSHCVHHLSLSSQSEDVIKKELILSKETLEQLLNTNITSFCYPFGMRSNVNHKVEEIAIKAGYQQACVAYNHKKINLLKIGRLGVSNNYHDFLNKVTGISNS